MANTSRQFGYRLFDGTPKNEGDLPFPSYVHIQLQYWTTIENAPTVTAQLMSEQEIDANIEMLKADLDHVAKLAKRALATVKNRVPK